MLILTMFFLAISVSKNVVINGGNACKTFKTHINFTLEFVLTRLKTEGHTEVAVSLEWSIREASF